MVWHNSNEAGLMTDEQSTCVGVCLTGNNTNLSVWSTRPQMATTSLHTELLDSASEDALQAMDFLRSQTIDDRGRR